MLENKNFIDCKMIVPAKVIKISSQDNYDGFESFCAGHIQHNIYLPSSYAEKEYDNRTILCEHEDDSYCTQNKGECEHKRKIGYIKTGSFGRLYPRIGEYVVVVKNTAFVVTEENFRKNFIKEKRYGKTSVFNKEY